MTYETCNCSRCTRYAHCIKFGSLGFCSACFEHCMNDFETQKIMGELLKNYGKD